MRRRKLSIFEQVFVQERAQLSCEYCKYPFLYSPDPFHYEHIISLFHGGTNDLINIAYSCDGCNTNKNIHIFWLDPETGVKSALYNPRKENWSHHFYWNDEFTQIIGKTSQGRATISLLKLNRLGLINVRKALIAFGVFPVE
jgi:HNH endonuclease